MQELRAKIAQLELEAAVGSSQPPAGTEALSQGADLIYHAASIPASDSKVAPKKKFLACSWDTLFSYIGPSMINECTDEEMMKKASLAFFHAASDEDRQTLDFDRISLPYVTEDRLRVQFQALGLIAPGIKRRAVSDGSQYWRLTPYGERYLMKIKAERRPTAP